MLEIARSEEEIDAVLDECARQEDQGGSRWPGMTYEQGVRNALDWALGQVDSHPLED